VLGCRGGALGRRWDASGLELNVGPLHAKIQWIMSEQLSAEARDGTDVHQSKMWPLLRDASKTFIYFLLMMGDAKLEALLRSSKASKALKEAFL
jgi:hypothetical protein